MARDTGDAATREQHLVDVGRRTPRVSIDDSEAVRELGYADRERMVLVVFTDSATVYGYPDLTDLEVAGLRKVLLDHKSLGRFVSTVIKPRHDRERIQF